MSKGIEPSFFHSVYAQGAPWDIDGPQPAFVALADAGLIEGSVLDVGCGTGENALFFASRGCEVWGVDIVETAIERAQEKAAQRGLSVRFQVANALELGSLQRAFDVAIDSGLFHVFGDADRARYAQSLARVVRPAGRLFLLCFNEHTPGDFGPRRVTQRELRDVFSSGWTVRNISAARFQTRMADPQPHAWLAEIEPSAAPLR